MSLLFFFLGLTFICFADTKSDVIKSQDRSIILMLDVIEEQQNMIHEMSEIILEQQQIIKTLRLSTK